MSTLNRDTSSNGDYNVNITDKIVSEFTNNNLDLNYWIALESDSTYQG